MKEQHMSVPKAAISIHITHIHAPRRKIVLSLELHTPRGQKRSRETFINVDEKDELTIKVRIFSQKRFYSLQTLGP